MAKLYYYLYYKIYNFSNNKSSLFYFGDWYTRFKASAAIDGIGIFIYFSIFYYLDIDFEVYLKQIMLGVFIIIGINFFIFDYSNKAQLYFEEFNNWSKQKNRIGGIIVSCLIVLVIVNLIFSFYLLDQKARENHTGPYSKEYLEQTKNK